MTSLYNYIIFKIMSQNVKYDIVIPLVIIRELLNGFILFIYLNNIVLFINKLEE